MKTYLTIERARGATYASDVEGTTYQPPYLGHLRDED